MYAAIVVASELNPRADNEDAMRCAQSVGRALDGRGIESAIIPLNESAFDGNDPLIDRRLFAGADCVFNLFEGFSYNSYAEVVFAEWLEKNSIPFTGNASRALRICLDKSACKKALALNGIPTPHGVMTCSVESLASLSLSYPVFIKPASEDASVGIDSGALCWNEESLRREMEKKIRLYPEGMIIEEFLPGVEYNASFIGSAQLIAVAHIDYAQYPDLPPFLTYDSKWNRESREYSAIQPVICNDNSIREKIRRIGSDAAQVLGCGGYFRIDFREKNGNLYVIDVNPNPDINEDAGFSNHARSAGYTYQDMIELIVKESFGGKNGRA
ncbi:MAG: ATP-grasp domain-containing protein [Candidatus Auribacterota bacterium]